MDIAHQAFMADFGLNKAEAGSGHGASSRLPHPGKGRHPLGHRHLADEGRHPLGLRHHDGRQNREVLLSNIITGANE